MALISRARLEDLLRLHGRWTPENRDFLEHLLDLTFPYTPIAVFDWDNTSITGDLGDSVFHHLALDLAFRHSLEEFAEWIREAQPDDELSNLYLAHCSNPVPQTARTLRTALERFRLTLFEGPDDPAAVAWDPGAFLGWSVDEARAYVAGVVAADLAREPSIELLDWEGEAVPVAWGMRLRPEIQELIRALHARDWQVWVISGSAQWEVEVMASQYGISPSRVVGMRREMQKGRITSAVAPPVPFSDGKLDAYRMFISRQQRPQFVAGDSINDWKLIEFADSAHLIVEPTGKHLRDYARWRLEEGEVWMLQEFESLIFPTKTL